MEHSHDALIIGRGIAGAVLAETLIQRGLRIHVFDHKRPSNASMAAAGVVNPVVLRRDVLSWRAAELLPLAEGFYTAMEQRYGTLFWHPMQLVKLFPGEQEERQWERAMQHPQTKAFIDRRRQAEVDDAPVNAPHGYGTVHRSAWLDVPAMLAAQREQLLQDQRITEANILPEEFELRQHGMHIRGYSAPWAIRCTGPFDGLPGSVPVKGEGITVSLPGLRVDRMLQRGVSVLPQGQQQYRVGATFAWDKVWEGPTPEARKVLLEKLAALCPIEAQVLDHWAGVRPTTADRRPILGIVAPHLAVLNGLGTRGVLLSPWCAAHLADHLFAGADLDTEVRHDRPFAKH